MSRTPYRFHRESVASRTMLFITNYIINISFFASESTTSTWDTSNPVMTRSWHILSPAHCDVWHKPLLRPCRGRTLLDGVNIRDILFYVQCTFQQISDRYFSTSQRISFASYLNISAEVERSNTLINHSLWTPETLLTFSYVKRLKYAISCLLAHRIKGLWGIKK